MRAGEDLERFVSVRVTHEDHAAMHELARRQEQTVSELLRECVAILVRTDRAERRKAKRTSTDNLFLRTAALR